MENRFFPAGTRINDAFLFFLGNYPEKDIWRFFVERTRYDIRKELFQFIKMCLDNKTVTMNGGEKVWNDLGDAEQTAFLNNITIANLLKLALDQNIEPLLFKAEHFFRFRESEMQIKLGDYLDKFYYWQGFEAVEPGYLKGMMNGLTFIMDALKNNRTFEVAFIKELHARCTSGVEGLENENKPGEFREDEISWAICSAFDSKEGMKENLKHLAENRQSGITILIDNEPIELQHYFDDEGRREAFVNKLFLMVKADDHLIEYHAGNPGYYTIAYLNERLTALVDKFNIAVNQAANEDQKLEAIFRFLKFSVLFHTFNDAVGRTYSMLLLFYLFCKNNLLPALFVNSNVIPGWSIEELVQHYKITRADVMRGCTDPAFLGSSAFHRVNLSTDQVLASLGEEQRRYFAECISMYHQAKANYLAPSGQVRSEVK